MLIVSREVQVQTEQPASLPNSALPPIAQHHLVLGGVGLATMVTMTALIREIRLLVQASKP